MIIAMLKNKNQTFFGTSLWIWCKSAIFRKALVGFLGLVLRHIQEAIGLDNSISSFEVLSQSTNRSEFSYPGPKWSAIPASQRPRHFPEMGWAARSVGAAVEVALAPCYMILGD